MVSAPTKMHAHCNTCGGDRNHEVLHKETSEWSTEEHDMWGKDLYEMLRCSGCGSIKLRQTSFSSEDPVPSETYFPPAVFRQEPRWFLDLWLRLETDEENVYYLLKEVYVALQNNQTALAAMGIRALLEHIMVSKCEDHGSFAKNIEQFEKAGFVSRIQRQSLETILEAGHATIHRSFRPSTEDLITLVNIAENIVEGIYVHGPEVEKLKKRIPGRPEKKPS